jgi:endoglucanase
LRAHAVFIIIIITAYMFWFGCEDTASPGGGFSLLRAQGTRIVDESGHEVPLKGVNLGNWFLLEMWMLGPAGSGLADQYSLEKLLETRFGGGEKERLLDLYREHYITERDFGIIKSFGMNMVRLPFWYTLLEDDAHPGQLKEGSWRWLDRAVDMAGRYGLYVVLDMHGAPGSQNIWDHSGRAGFNRLWSDERYRERTVRLWLEIARHYRGRKVICGYDLLNEPWGGTEAQLLELCERCYRAVRTVDSEHMIIFSGYYNRIGFYGKPCDRGWENIALTCHFYPGFFGNGEPLPSTHNDFIMHTIPQYRRELADLGVPMLVGEFNVVLKSAGGGRMMRRYFDTYNGLGWAAAMWSYKVFTAGGGIGDGSWGMVTNREPLAPIDFRTTSKARIERWFSNLSAMEYSINEDLKYRLTETTQRKE